eukprot:2727462-Alexandrium_andersonii.AAC.1
MVREAPACGDPVGSGDARGAAGWQGTPCEPPRPPELCTAVPDLSHLAPQCLMPPELCTAVPD